MAFPLTAVPIIGDLLKAGMDIIDKMVPDKDLAAKMKQELVFEEMKQRDRYLQIAAQESAQQADINKVEAAGNWYQSGWRPSLGYVCVLGFAYNFVAYPILQWYVAVYGSADFKMPPLLDNMLWELTAGMLGLATVRTWEKLGGTGKKKR